MKNLKKILMLVLTAAMLITLIACGDNPPPECTVHVDDNSDGKCDVCEAVVEPEEKPDPKPVAKELTLIADGEARFSIVISKNNPGSTVKKAVDGLVKTLKELDVEVKQLTESADNATDCEVLIGIPTERGEGYDMDVHTLGPEGYVVKLINGKILIAGGSDAAIVTAIDAFTEEFLGIDRKTKELTTVTVKSSQNIEAPQTDFRITSLKLDGEDMKDYTIAADITNASVKAAAQLFQNALYERAGCWLPIVAPENADKSVVIRVNPNTYKGNGFYVDVKDGQLVIETEFPNKLEEWVGNYVAKNITIAQGEVDFTSKKHKSSVNVRDIGYEEFGAVGGDGKCDLVAIFSAHKYANEWGHSIKAKSGAVYNIDTGNYQKNIKIMTDTDWNGCKFIFNDSLIAPNSNDMKTSVFTIAPDKVEQLDAAKIFAHVTEATPWIDEGDNITTNIGWAPGVKCLLYVESNEKKQYIRYGANANSGSNMQEMILVDAEGNIDPTTPLQWSYTRITKAIMYSAEDRPITVGNAKVDTIFNNAPSEYTYYIRNITVARSNATLENLEWKITDDAGLQGAPYYGLAYVDRCNNVTVKNYTFAQPPQYKTDTATQQGVGMGSYGICMFRATNVYLREIHQNDYRDENRVVHSKGAQGSNYCKNLFLIDSEISLFDAHCGTYSATLIDSEVVSLNMIGEGTLRLERIRLVGGDNNSHLGAGSEGLSIGLRNDYGATWKGTVEIIDCTLELTVRSHYNLFKSSAFANKHDFGYTCYFPTKIVVDGLKVETLNGDERSDITVNLTNYLNTVTYPDLSVEGPDVTNPYMPCEELIIKNCDGIIWRLPDTPMFKNMKVYMDGEEVVNWKSLYGTNSNSK